MDALEHAHGGGAASDARHEPGIDADGSGEGGQPRVSRENDGSHNQEGEPHRQVHVHMNLDSRPRENIFLRKRTSSTPSSPPDLLWTCEAVSFAANCDQSTRLSAPTSPEPDACYTCGCAAKRRVYGRGQVDSRNVPETNATTFGGSTRPLGRVFRDGCGTGIWPVSDHGVGRLIDRLANDDVTNNRCGRQAANQFRDPTSALEVPIEEGRPVVGNWFH